MRSDSLTYKILRSQPVMQKKYKVLARFYGNSHNRKSIERATRTFFLSTLDVRIYDADQLASRFYVLLKMNTR